MRRGIGRTLVVVGVVLIAVALASDAAWQAGVVLGVFATTAGLTLLGVDLLYLRRPERPIMVSADVIMANPVVVALEADGHGAKRLVVRLDDGTEVERSPDVCDLGALERWSRENDYCTVSVAR